MFAIRSNGSEARFLTVIEPYEDKPLVTSAVATGPDTLKVELADGRAQEITIKHLDGNGRDIAVQIIERKAGRIVRAEATPGG